MSDNLYPIQETELTDLLEKKPATGNGHSYTNGLHKDEDGLVWPRVFGAGETSDPYGQINWEIRTARITKGNGEVVFEQKNVEVPDFWSQTATDIVASKYFRGQIGTPGREYSARQMIDRVADTISGWGFKDRYFKTEQDYINFRDDLKYLLINQYAAFNSPVWFNVGNREHPQCSACFILAVEDTMQSILDWYRDEGWIFKFGSGSGTNLSKLRSSKEPLSRGGYSSGPVSFMKGADGVANSIRSGGTTRRAAKMVILNADHPDIKDFIYCKKHIEEMTRVLEASGIKASIEGELFNPYTLLPYQNANNSVRVTDDFMRRVENGGDWELKAVTTGRALETRKAGEVMDWIADAAWHSADPGMQFDTTINNWHTVPNSGPINASNPCSEYMSIDNSACNLASINLLKFMNANGSYDVEGYKKAIDTLITAQEIIINNSSYPTEKITRNAIDFRQLGLGYANLGALLMSLGLPYNSDDGRDFAAVLTSILSGEAYVMSAKLAAVKGPFTAYEHNRQPMHEVIRMHALAARNLELTAGPWLKELSGQSVHSWQEALASGEKTGYRNSQVSLLAPTGTIAFLMDCQTTGIEPELALIKYKKLVGGGTLKLVNGHVIEALKRLGYGELESREIYDYILKNETIEGAPHIKTEHLPVFDCSFKAANGQRSIDYMGHIKMMGAVQPFISGAISKTVNLPSNATVGDIRDAFMQAWRHGLKAIAVYRDGCKSVQPLNTSKEDDKLVEKVNGFIRHKLPDTRPSITHKFSIGNHEGYLTVGMYPDTKKPGETFITIAKEGSAISGLLDVIATFVSISLQSGTPLKTLVNKFKDMRFEPSGITSNPDIPFAKSFIDYIFRYLGYTFLTDTEKEEVFGRVPEKSANGLNGFDSVPASDPLVLEPSSAMPVESFSAPVHADLAVHSRKEVTDAPLCEKCGSMMFRAGSCFTCSNCFATTGVCN